MADRSGDFSWSAPDAEVHSFVNALERGIGTHLFGRRMYEVLSAWETMDDDEPTMREYAEIWHASDKVVYSRTLDEVWTARTRLERDFDPEAVRRMKSESARDLSIGGPELAAQALQAGLVDECHLFLTPVVVGSGTRVLPTDLRVGLELLDHRRFGNGTVHLHYRVALG